MEEQHLREIQRADQEAKEQQQYQAAFQDGVSPLPPASSYVHGDSGQYEPM
jgi:hypothetical protein